MILPKTKTSALMLFILTIAMSFFITNTTYAAGNTQDNIVKKSYLQGLGVCYELKNGGTDDDYKEGWGPFTSNVKDDNYESMTPDQYQLAGEVATSTYENDFSYKKLFPKEPAKNKIRLPNGWTPESGDSKTNCAHLVNGGDGFSDTIYDRFNKPEAKIQGSSSADDIKKFMEKMGYKKESGSTENGRKCFTITYDWQKYEINDDDSWRQLSNEKGAEKSSEVCADIENGIVTKLSYPNDTMDARYLSLGVDYMSGGVTIDFIMAYDPENFDYNCNVMNGMNCYPFGSNLDDGGQEGLAYLSIYDKNYSWDQFYDELEKRVNALKGGKDNFSNVYNGDDFGYAIGLTGKSINVTDSQATDVVWKLNGSRATARNKAISYLNTGNNIGSSYSKLGLTESQAVVLYQHYIKDVAQATVNCDLDSPSSTDVAVKWFESATERKDCYITGYNADETEYNIVDDKGYFTLGVKFSELVNKLNAMAIDTLDGVDDAIESSQSTIEANPDDPNNDQDEKDENDACYAGAGAMGWLLCPVIMSLEGLMNDLYSFIEQNFLVIHSSGIFNGTGSDEFKTNSVKDAWSKLQAIANIIFVIFFIVILFSQITGVGISNYGIKKMLPKLIVTAVLINLSYIICEILVDLSNIIGVGLRSLLDSGLGIEAAQGSSAGSKVAGFAVAGTITLTSLIIAVCTNPGLVVTFLLFLGSAAIAVLFLWLVLVIREVIIVLGIVLAPVAFACSAFPNTESLFKKWTKIMQAMLILYPLCSLVVGGGQFAGRVLASLGQNNAELGWTFSLAAMIAQVVPFFFIPTLLKGTLNGLGTLGAKLSQGQKWTNANTMGRIRNSDRYKDFQMRSRAGMKADGTLSKRGELMNRGPFKAFNRGTNAARASYLGRKGQIDRMNKYSDKDYLAAARVAEDDRVYNEEVANALTLFDSQGATSADLLAAVSKDGGARSIAAIQKLAQKKDFNGIQQALATIDVAGLSPNERNKLGQTLAAMQDTDVIAGLYGKKLLKGDKYSYADYAKGNAKDKSGNSIVQKDLRNVDGAKLGRLDDNVYDSNSTFDYSQILRDNMSGDQMASLVSSTGDLNSKNLDKVNEHIIGKKIADEVSSGVRAEDSVFSGASGAQVSGISESTIDAINGNGGDAQKIFASGISEINSPKNAAIRVNMNSNAKTKLGVHETPTVLGHGTYALNSDPNNRVHLTQLDNGKYVDDGGFEVDITKYNKV